MLVRCSAIAPDFSLRELGTAGAGEALALFRGRPWSEELAEADLRESRLEECTSPDITFTAPTSHMTITATREDAFEVEVCLPRQRKLFGLFVTHKFYVFSALPRMAVEELIPAFFAEALAVRHEGIKALHQRYSLKQGEAPKTIYPPGTRRDRN